MTLVGSHPSETKDEPDGSSGPEKSGNIQISRRLQDCVCFCLYFCFASEAKPFRSRRFVNGTVSASTSDTVSGVHQQIVSFSSVQSMDELDLIGYPGSRYTHSAEWLSPTPSRSFPARCPAEHDSEMRARDELSTLDWSAGSFRDDVRTLILSRAQHGDPRC